MRDLYGELDKILRERVRFGELFDAYFSLLTEKQREVCDLLLGGDLSVTELGETFGMTRQGAYDLVRRSRERLEEIEGALGLIELRKAHEALMSLIDENESALPDEFITRARILRRNRGLEEYAPEGVGRTDV
jgi:predicted DNA-binding protein YlxM (UPF0122 family)